MGRSRYWFESLAHSFELFSIKIHFLIQKYRRDISEGDIKRDHFERKKEKAIRAEF